MPTERCIFEGELGEIQIPDVLTFLDMLGKTGTLDVSHGEVHKRIHWDRGEIVFADSSLEVEHLPAYLCVNGWVDDSALEAARGKAGTDAGVVKELIRAGALEAAFLPRAVRSLVIDIVYSVFEWKDGRFRFLLADEPHPERLSLKTSVSNTIVEGCRRLDEWARIRDEFPSESLIPVPTGTPDASHKLSPTEMEVHGFCNGRATIRQVIRAVSHDQFTVLSALLTLLNARLIRVSSEPAAGPPPPPPRSSGLDPAEHRTAEEVVAVFNNIFAGMLERIVRAKGEDGRARWSATVEKESFQRSDVFQGVRFDARGTLPAAAVLANLTSAPAGERLSRLRAGLDRLLAQQVRLLDMSYADQDRKAVSDLISREKARLAAV